MKVEAEAGRKQKVKAEALYIDVEAKGLLVWKLKVEAAVFVEAEAVKIKISEVKGEVFKNK